MSADTPYQAIKQALTEWQHAAEAAMRMSGSGAVPNHSPLIPAHVRTYLEEALPKATSIYKVGVCFTQALEMAKYPPGFESPHPAYLAYKGTGISARDHVQNHTFDFKCPKCHTIDHVVVLASEWGVNIMNGDARGRFNATCTRCGTHFSGGFED